MDLSRFAVLLAIAAATSMVAARAEAAQPANADEAACRQALDQLHTREEALRAARLQHRGAERIAGTRGALDAARRHAAQACLGGPPDQPIARQRVQPPRSVTSINPIGPPAGPASPSTHGQPLSSTTLGQLIGPATVRQGYPVLVPSPSAPQPPIDPRPPSRITSCGVAGCWTSDGQYLMRHGPDSTATPGPCTIQAGVLSCR